MQANDQQYHSPKVVICRAETITMQGLEDEAENGFITLGYSDRLKVTKFKSRVGRKNERLASALLQ